MQPPATAEDTPAALGGGDVDCFVEGLDPHWPLRLPRGWRLLQSLQYLFSRWQWWLEGPHGSVVFDTTEDPRGLENGFSTRALMGESEEALPAARAVYLTQKRLEKGMRDLPRWQQIASLAADDPTFYRATVIDALGESLGTRVAGYGTKGEPPPQSLIEAHRRTRLLRRLRRPHHAFAYYALEARRVIKRTLQPTGLHVVVVGPDGSGKSTFAEALIDASLGLFRRQVHIHWTPGTLPHGSEITGSGPPDTTTPHAQKPRSMLLSHLALAYYWTDNVLGGWGPLRHARRRTGLVLVERSWWDIAVDPARYRMKVTAGMVALLGKVLPRPDVIFILDAPPQVIAARKPELSEAEIRRQTEEWKERAPRIAPTVRLDASAAPEKTVADAREHLATQLEARTASRIAHGWFTSPGNRWVLPRGPSPAAHTALSVYHPMTRRGRIVWRTTRVAASIGALRLFPRGAAPPFAIREQLGMFVPRGGTYAVARTNHADRWVAMIVDSRGKSHAVVKLALTTKAAQGLRNEALNLERFRDQLESPLTAPRLFDQTDSALVFEPIRWRVRKEPWFLPSDVAYAIGRFARTGSTHDESVAHGDFAPWNLFETAHGWTLIDWEAAGNSLPPMYDLFHFMVQSHTLLGRPTQREIADAFDNRGRFADAVASFRRGYGKDADNLLPTFEAYLATSRKQLDGIHAADARAGVEARDRLLATLR